MKRKHEDDSDEKQLKKLKKAITKQEKIVKQAKTAVKEAKQNLEEQRDLLETMQKELIRGCNETIQERQSKKWMSRLENPRELQIWFQNYTLRSIWNDEKYPDDDEDTKKLRKEMDNYCHLTLKEITAVVQFALEQGMQNDPDCQTHWSILCSNMKSALEFMRDLKNLVQVVPGLWIKETEDLAFNVIMLRCGVPHTGTIQENLEHVRKTGKPFMAMHPTKDSLRRLMESCNTVPQPAESVYELATLGLMPQTPDSATALS